MALRGQMVRSKERLILKPLLILKDGHVPFIISLGTLVPLLFYVVMSYSLLELLSHGFLPRVGTLN
jgi:hypothetical protein